MLFTLSNRVEYMLSQTIWNQHQKDMIEFLYKFFSNKNKVNNVLGLNAFDTLKTPKLETMTSFDWRV